MKLTTDMGYTADRYMVELTCDSPGCKASVAVSVAHPNGPNAITDTAEMLGWTVTSDTAICNEHQGETHE
jgi:hypothetical protein